MPRLLFPTEPRGERFAQLEFTPGLSAHVATSADPLAIESISSGARKHLFRRSSFKKGEAAPWSFISLWCRPQPSIWDHYALSIVINLHHPTLMRQILHRHWGLPRLEHSYSRSSMASNDPWTLKNPIIVLALWSQLKFKLLPWLHPKRRNSKLFEPNR